MSSNRCLVPCAAPGALSLVIVAALVVPGGVALAAPPAQRAPHAAAQSAEPWVELTVVRRDSLIGLSRHVLISPRAWREVARFNQLANPDLLLPGQVLRVPTRLVKMLPVNGQVIDVEGEAQAVDASGARAMRTGDNLAEGVQLSTGERGSAVVGLADGSRVRLLPNSLAALSASRVVAGRSARGVPAPASVAANAPGSAPTTGASSAPSSGTTPARDGWFVGTMRLVRGSMEVLASKIPRAKPLEVETPTTVVGVRGTDYRVGVEQTGDEAAATRVEVLEGRVQVDARAALTLQPASTLLQSGRGVYVDARGGMQLEALMPAPDLAGLATRVEVPLVRFDWPHAAPVRVQVARRADFNEVVFDQKMAATEPLHVGGLEDGTWHLRVRQVSAGGIEGFDANHVFVLKARPEPPASQAPRPQSKHPVGGVLFSWAPNTLATHSRLQVARDAGFTQIVEQRDGLTGDSLSLSVPQPGHYFWRLASNVVATSGASDAGPWGAVQQFDVRPLPLPPSNRLAEDGALVLSWGEVDGSAGAVRYAVELARDEQFAQPIVQTELSAPQWRIKGPGWHTEPGSIAVSGTAYFRYRTIEPDGYVSPPSAPLKVELPRDPRGPWMLLLPPALLLL
jgi:hypothetical protein